MLWVRQRCRELGLEEVFVFDRELGLGLGLDMYDFRERLGLGLESGLGLFVQGSQQPLP